MTEAILLIVVGIACTALGLVEWRDYRNGKGQFSSRHMVSFESWKITRHLVRFNSVMTLVYLLGSGPTLTGLGIWLLVS
ncbi:hypothetical protein H8M03_05360 [Sphingomonas sabuli]|uniref:Uncharacterized protein n=1 Tax=Sphingomonas sabuli TaxID=2764186 RepID=A0A7G9L550_9SPHN|nr:hypothetical protein [Sphingomonas sabuli]QNM83749.1 hypothetical protein H8M03_05360 [Sphingomonas sabuli]